MPHRRHEDLIWLLLFVAAGCCYWLLLLAVVVCCPWLLSLVVVVIGCCCRGVVAERELTPAQLRNISDYLLFYNGRGGVDRGWSERTLGLSSRKLLWCFYFRPCSPFLTVFEAFRNPSRSAFEAHIGPFWEHVGTKTGSFGGHLGFFWHRFGVFLGPCWHFLSPFSAFLRSFCDFFVMFWKL